MDYGKLLQGAWQTIRQRPFLIWLGILAAVGNETFNTYTRLTIGDPLSDPQALLNFDPSPVLVTLEARLTDISWLISAASILMGVLLVIWLVTTIAEAGLIAAVGTQQPQSFVQAMRAGVRYLWRFILVDTVLFFPLFVVALSILLITFGTFINIALTATNDTNAIMTAFFRMFTCIGPLVCLLLPVSVLTMLSRTIAFRTAALDDLSTRPTLRHTWYLFRRHIGPILLTAVMIIAVRTTVGIIRTIVTTPLTLLSAGAPAPTSMFIYETAVTILSLIVAGVLHAYTSALWTHFYQKLQ